MQQNRTWRTRASVLFVVAFGLAGGLAACGSDSSNDTSTPASSTPAPASTAAAATTTQPDGGVAQEAVDNVAKAKEPPSAFVGPTDPITPGTGKTVVFVTCGNFLEGCRMGGQEAQAAGKVLGWNVKVVDGKGDPTVWNSAVQDAVAQKVDGIITAAIPPALIQGAVAAANKAKIPVVSTYLPAVPDDPGKGIDAVVGPDYTVAAKAVADWVAVDSGGKAKIGYFYDPTYVAAAFRDKAFLAEIAKVCPGCEVVRKISFSAAKAATALAGLTNSALQKDPTIDYIVSPFDAVQTFLLQGIRQAGKADAIKVASYEGQVDALQRVNKGEINAADMAESIVWGAWMSIDTMARLQDGQKVEPGAIPQRLFVKENAPTNGWDGDFDFRAEYKKLWGK